MVEAECAQDGDPGKDCSCIASQLDDGLPDRVKAAFPALRWPMKPAPQDREAVNNQLLRAAGVDPADRQAVESIRQEFKASYYAVRNAVRAACGASVLGRAERCRARAWDIAKPPAVGRFPPTPARSTASPDNPTPDL